MIAAPPTPARLAWWGCGWHCGGMSDAITMITSQNIANVDKAARRAREDIANAQPIQLLIRAMASGQYNGKPLTFEQVKDVAKYLGDKIVPSLKSVDVNNRTTPADPAEWVDFLLKAAGKSVDVTPRHQRGGDGVQFIEKPQEGGWGEKGGVARSPGGIPPVKDGEFGETCIQNKKSEMVPERISSAKRPSGLDVLIRDGGDAVAFNGSDE